MNTLAAITCLFVDIGGVLLTDGWPHESRALASKKFDLNWDEWEGRHRAAFETYEIGKLSLDEYLNRVVFFKERSFTREQFKEFMFAQTKPYPEMIELVRKLKAKYGLKIVVVSNEAREINDYRIRTFKLEGLRPRSWLSSDCRMMKKYPMKRDRVSPHRIEACRVVPCSATSGANNV